MNKVISIEEAVSKIEDGAVIMVGGFLVNGAPVKMIDALVEKNVKDLTIIVSDSAYADRGVGKLVANKQVKKIMASHIGTNTESGKQLLAGEIEVELVPQGTLVERIRAGGYGLGGILTRTGIGTLIEDGKQKINVDGVDYLLEKPLKADVSLIFGSVVDKGGNIRYKGSTNNFNNVMASAGAITIVEAQEIVEQGEIDPNTVNVPAIFVNYIVDGGDQ